MHRGRAVYAKPLPRQPVGLRQVRIRQLQHQSALLPEQRHMLPGGLGILLQLRWPQLGLGFAEACSPGRVGSLRHRAGWRFEPNMPEASGGAP